MFCVLYHIVLNCVHYWDRLLACVLFMLTLAVFEEIQMIEQQDELRQSQQTSASTPKNVNPNPRQFVQRLIRPSKCEKTSWGRGVISFVGGRRRTRTAFQEDIEGLGKRTSLIWDHFTIVA